MNSITIAINCRVLTERKGGPYRYTINIINELRKIDLDNNYILLFNKSFDFDFDLPQNFKKVILPSNSKIIFDYILLPFYSWKNKIDTFIFPKNTFSPFVRGKKIPVYHDIVYFEKNLNFREFNFFDNLHHKIMIPVASKFSAFDLTVSNFTAGRMKSLLGIDDEKIKIAREGVENSFKVINDKKHLNEVKEKLNITIPFLFYSGSLSPRKNMIRTIEAFAMIKDKIPHNIYFTASYSWRDDEVNNVIEKYNISGRVKKLGYLSEDELIAMYNMADCYLYPSLYEGFGLPILEAQACGCPVITGTAASCPEIAGEGALLIDPYSIEEISNAIKKIVTDKKLKNNLVKKGFVNIKKYSWHKCAREILSYIEEFF